MENRTEGILDRKRTLFISHNAFSLKIIMFSITWKTDALWTDKSVFFLQLLIVKLDAIYLFFQLLYFTLASRHSDFFLKNISLLWSIFWVFIQKLVFVMTLLPHNLINTEHALKQIFKILMRPSKKNLTFNRNFSCIISSY